MLAVLITLALALVYDARETVPGSTQGSQAEIGSRLIQDPAVTTAIDRIKRGEPRVLDDQIRLCEIPAPPFKETRRAEAFRQELQSLGLQNVRIDRAGNVIAERPGTDPKPRLVLSAHLDTVFGEDVDVKTSRSGSVLKGPGISDDCRGLAVLLGVVRTLEDGHFQTTGPITFVGTVGEE